MSTNNRKVKESYDGKEKQPLITRTENETSSFQCSAPKGSLSTVQVMPGSASFEHSLFIGIANIQDQQVLQQLAQQQILGFVSVDSTSLALPTSTSVVLPSIRLSTQQQNINQCDPPSNLEQSSISNCDDSRTKMLRDRNRENSRSTRLRKKAYVKKLKDLVENLTLERNEELRQRHMAVQRAADLKTMRRNVVLTFLRYHSSYETDYSKWSNIIEDTFWLKQPVTPFRSFRGAEVEKEYRFSRGLESVVNDAASFSVMLENIGCHSLRWVRMKREDFLRFEETKRCPDRKMPSCVERQFSRLYHSVSSLSASSQSDSSNDEETEQNAIVQVSGKVERNFLSKQETLVGTKTSEMLSSKQSSSSDSKVNKVSSSSGGSGGSGSDGGSNGSNNFQDYHTKTLSNPNNDSHDRSASDASPSDDSSKKSNSSSGAELVSQPAAKRRKTESVISDVVANKEMSISVSCNSRKHNHGRAFLGYMKRQVSVLDSTSQPLATSTGQNGELIETEFENEPHLIFADTLTTISDSDCAHDRQIKGRYLINDDDIMSLDDVLMCPFIFRSVNAVVCGAFSECVMPGMLRAQFSPRNKLQCLELVYDSMGFMQQLERASGSISSLPNIPGSLGVALIPNYNDARVITMAEPPYLIVNVNAVWTRITGYTQLESEGKGYLELLEGDATIDEAKNRPGKPAHFLDRVARGQPSCSTNIHYDKNGRDFIEFVCSYPLTNAVDEATHILHVSRELPSFESLPLQSKN